MFYAGTMNNHSRVTADSYGLLADEHFKVCAESGSGGGVISSLLSQLVKEELK